MIYQYKNNGYNIVLDVNSGSVHVVDDVVYDVIPLFEEKRKEERKVRYGYGYNSWRAETGTAGDYI